jgi:glycosyltransferase involved in cell wall biosynthesis
MTAPHISCIIPVFNGEKYLSEAIESILKQTYPFLEIIVVDDGSTDGTATVVSSYRSRIRYVRQSNAGPAMARNLGLSAARGDYLAFLDADDLWHPAKLERQVACFQHRCELELCVTHVQNFWVPELKDEADRFRNHRLTRPLPGYVTQTLLARRALFERVGPFNVALRHGDAQDWFLRAAEEGAVMKLLPDVLVYRRLHHGNFSREVSAAHDDHLLIIKASLDRRRVGGSPLRKYDFNGADHKKNRGSASE